MDIQSFAPGKSPQDVRTGQAAPPLSLKLPGSAGDYAEVLEDVEKDPGVIKARIEAGSLQKEYDTFETGLKLPRKDRFNRFPDLYKTCWTKAMEPHKPVTKAIVYGTFFGGPILGYATMAMGLDPRIGGIITLASLVAAFSSRIGTGRMYVEIVKRWVIPPKIDKMMQTQLERDRSELEGRLTQAKETLDQKRATVMKRIAREIQQRQDASINDDPDFVNIDGIKLNKKKERTTIFPA